MDLASYLKEHKLSQKAFAALLGCHPSLVSQLIGGKTGYTAERAADIERITGGKVKRHELRPTLFDAPCEHCGK